MVVCGNPADSAIIRSCYLFSEFPPKVARSFFRFVYSDTTGSGSTSPGSTRHSCLTSDLRIEAGLFAVITVEIGECVPS